MLHVTIEDFGETAILHCVGRIVRGDEAALLCAALGHDAHSIILDLGRVEAIDAAGVGALISLQAAGIYLQLMNPGHAVREILRITKLDSIFEIRSTAVAGTQNDAERQNELAAAFFPAIAAPAA
jgi:anti-anti-sigma factor